MPATGAVDIDGLRVNARDGAAIRDQEHLSCMRKFLTAHDVILHPVAAGKIDDLTFAFKGLIIVDHALWDQVKNRQVEARAARDEKFGLAGNARSGDKRPQHLLTGLVKCGVCGGDYIGMNAGRWRCKAAMRKVCSNGSITAAELEDRALAGLCDRLLTPEIVGRFAVHLQRELDSQMRAAHGRHDELEAFLVETSRRIAKLVKQMEEDDDLPRSVMARLKNLERDEERLERELANLPEHTVVRLPANYEAVDRSAIAELDQHLAPREASPSRNAIRTLIEAVVVHGGNSRGGKHHRLELRGDLFRMLVFAEAAAAGSLSSGAQKRRKPQSGPTEALVVAPLVAGTGFEPVTFRL